MDYSIGSAGITPTERVQYKGPADHDLVIYSFERNKRRRTRTRPEPMDLEENVDDVDADTFYELWKERNPALHARCGPGTLKRHGEVFRRWPKTK